MLLFCINTIIMIIELAHETICCLQQGAAMDMTGSIRKRRHDRQLDTGSGDLGSQLENLQHLRSSEHLLYREEQCFSDFSIVGRDTMTKEVTKEII